MPLSSMPRSLIWTRTAITRPLIWRRALPYSARAATRARSPSSSRVRATSSAVLPPPRSLLNTMSEIYWRASDPARWSAPPHERKTLMSTLAVTGGAPVRATPFPEWPIHDQREVDAVVEVVKSGRWGGNYLEEADFKTDEFAARFAAYHD